MLSDIRCHIWSVSASSTSIEIRSGFKDVRFQSRVLCELCLFQTCNIFTSFLSVYFKTKIRHEAGNVLCAASNRVVFDILCNILSRSIPENSGSFLCEIGDSSSKQSRNCRLYTAIVSSIVARHKPPPSDPYLDHGLVEVLLQWQFWELSMSWHLQKVWQLCSIPNKNKDALRLSLPDVDFSNSFFRAVFFHVLLELLCHQEWFWALGTRISWRVVFRLNVSS